MSTAPASSDDFSMLPESVAARLRWTPDGLINVVVQQHDTREVLMVAWMNAEALRRTMSTGQATYWSRSRGDYWVKGETSGHTQRVHRIQVDCDGDALLLQVDQSGPACHTGEHSCFDAIAIDVDESR